MKKLTKILTLVFSLGLVCLFTVLTTVTVKAVSQTAVYTITSSTAVSASNSPKDSTAEFSQPNGTLCQLVSGNTMTLTLSGYDGMIVKGITLSMKSNSTKGSGYLSIVAGSTTIASIGSSSSGVAFSNKAWNGSYTTAYVSVSPTVAEYTVQESETIVITIGATANSLYCQSFSITYDDGSTKVDVTSVSIDETLDLDLDETQTLTATVLPADASDKSVSWSSSDETVVTVDATGKVTGIAAGTATITCTTTDGSKTDTCEVIVTPSIQASIARIEMKKQLAFHYSVKDTYSLVESPATDTKYYIGSIVNDTIRFAGASSSDLYLECLAASTFSLLATSADGQYLLFNTTTEMYYGAKASDSSNFVTTNSKDTADSNEKYKWEFIDNKLVGISTHIDATDTAGAKYRFLGINGSKVALYSHEEGKKDTYSAVNFYSSDGDVDITELKFRIMYTVSAELYKMIMTEDDSAVFSITINSKSFDLLDCPNADGSHTFVAAITDIPTAEIITPLTVEGFVTVNGTKYTTKQTTASVKTTAKQYLDLYAADKENYAVVGEYLYELSYIANVM